MDTKFSGFLTEKKLDPRRILAASHKIEKFRREDRMTRLAQRKARQSEDAEAKKGEKVKTRSGRPVTPRAMHAALEGKPLTGPQKTRILRAVNHLLEQKKQEPVALRVLF